MRNASLRAVIAVTTLAMVAPALASPLIYRPLSPSFLGGDPLNGSWLLSQATAQSEGGGSPGFTIDFPDFGGIPQPVVPENPVGLPQVPVTGQAMNRAPAFGQWVMEVPSLGETPAR